MRAFCLENVQLCVGLHHTMTSPYPKNEKQAKKDKKTTTHTPQKTLIAMGRTWTVDTVSRFTLLSQVSLWGVIFHQLTVTDTFFFVKTGILL